MDLVPKVIFPGRTSPVPYTAFDLEAGDVFEDEDGDLLLVTDEASLILLCPADRNSYEGNVGVQYDDDRRVSRGPWRLSEIHLARRDE